MTKKNLKFRNLLLKKLIKSAKSKSLIINFKQPLKIIKFQFEDPLF